MSVRTVRTVRTVLLLPILLSGCQGGVDDAFFVRHDGADMPVWLQGDPASDTFVLVQHGSGASGKVYDYQPAFDVIEAEHAIVYWDQRGAGISQGNAAAAGLTLDTFVGDLALVRAAVEDRWAPERLVLLGHSLGGGLSLAYLRDPVRAEGVAGYVDVSGGRSLLEAFQLVRAEMLLQCGALGRDDCVAFYEPLEAFPREEPGRSTHAAFVEEVVLELGFDMGASTADMQAEITRRSLSDTLTGGMDVLAYLQNTQRFASTFELDGVDLSTEDVASVPVPALVIAGAYDFSVPADVSRGTYEAFAAGRPPSELVVLDDAGHFPMWDRPDAFAEAVLRFVAALP